MALPAITSISPASGPTGGGTAVAIHGTDFSGATAVFGGAEAAGVTVQSATLIDATAPPGTGTVHVTVITPAGSSAPGAAAQFAYTAVACRGLVANAT